MKIEVKQDKNAVTFGSIEAGVVFKYGDYYYIKTNATFRFEGANYNAIDLDDGDFSIFNDNEVIYVPSAKLVIE